MEGNKQQKRDIVWNVEIQVPVRARIIKAVATELAK